MSFEIVDYSEKSIAVFGDINKYESHFTELKGMFNANLKYKGESKPGFIFTKFKRPQVQDLVRKLKVIDSTSGIEQEEEKTGSGEKTERKTFSNMTKSDDNVILSREQFMNLVSTLNRLEQDVAYLKKQVLSSGGQNNQNNIISMISVPAEKETKSVRTVKKDVKKEVNKEESSDEDYSNEFDEGDVEFEMPQTKGPSLLKKTVKKEEVVEKESVKKGPSLLKRG